MPARLPPEPSSIAGARAALALVSALAVALLGDAIDAARVYGFDHRVLHGLAVVYALSGPLVLAFALLASGASRRPSEAPAAFVASARQLLSGPGTEAATWLFALTLAAAAHAALTFAGARWLVERIVRPRNLAIFVAVLSLGVTLAVALAAPLALRVGRRLAEFLARVPRTAWLWARGSRVAAAYALTLAAPLGVEVAVGWRAFYSYLPWSVGLRLGAAGLALALAVGWVTRWSARTRRAALFSAGTAWAVAAAVALTLSPSDWIAKDVAFARSVLGAPLFAGLLAAADADGDGHLGFLGGGDCAPRDERRFPGALDVPDDGVDQDCDGRDARAARFFAERRTDWPLPGDIPARPHVVLVTLDAVSPRHLGVFGADPSPTPRLDAFFDRAALFTRAFAQGPSTRLSLPALFTSRWDSRSKRRRGRAQPFSIGCRGCTLAEHLRDAGYATHAVVSSAYFSRSRWAAAAQGFDGYDESPIGDAPHNAPAVTDAALDAVRSHEEGPLFLWVHYYDAHHPHDRPEGIEPRGSDERDLYDAELAHLDAHVTRLLEGLRQQMPDALIVLTSDHGNVFHPRPELRKARYGQDLHTATLHVPLAFDAPWIPPGPREGLVSLLDVSPTVLNLARVRGAETQGESLVPELFERRVRSERATFHQFYLGERVVRSKDPLAAASMRTARYNLVLDRDTGRYALYDWRADYYELRDLLARPEDAPPEAEALKTVLQAYLGAVHSFP